MKSKTFLFLGIAAVAIIALLCVKSLFIKKKDFNILLITMDTTRADRLGCYGYEKNTTPHIDAISKESVLFSSAVAPLPYTLPSHLTIMTGTLPIYHGLHGNLDGQVADWNLTLAEVLKERGYRTGAILAAYILNAKFGLNQGFETYNDFTQYHTAKLGYRRASETARLSNEWLQENKGDKFFLFTHFFDPHHPYDPPEPFAAEFEDPYDGEIASVDHAIGQMIDKLKELELYDNTMIIIEADHGEMCGDHGEATHGYYIYEGAIKVPLIVKLPGSVEPRRVSDTVGLVDIFPTVCGALGIKVPDFIQGVDLGPYLEGKDIDQERYQYIESMTPVTMLGANSLLGVVGNSYKYIQTTRPELYDFIKDPAEENNLTAEDPKRALFMQGNLKHILDTCSKTADEDKSEVDLETRKQLESLGYIGGKMDASLSFDQSKPDPKDLDYLFFMQQKAADCMVWGDYDNAKILCKKLIAEMPDSEKAKRLAIHVWITAAKAAKTPSDKARAFEEAGDMLFRFNKCKIAIGNWNEALKSGGGSAELHKKLAAAYLDLKNVDEAISHLHLSLYFDPDQADVFNMLGNSVYGLGNVDQAVEYWINSLKINPDQHQLHDTLVKVYYPRGKYEKVVEHLTESARLQPDNAEVLNNLAWIHSAFRNPAVRNPTLAVEYAQRACKLTKYKNADYVDTLAIAYAAEKQFPQAIATAQKALGLAVSERNENLVDDINKRIELYKTNQTYYDAGE